MPPALAVNGYGCFLPDLTRFTTLQCGEARQFFQAIQQPAAQYQETVTKPLKILMYLYIMRIQVSFLMRFALAILSTAIEPLISYYNTIK